MSSNQTDSSPLRGLQFDGAEEEEEVVVGMLMNFDGRLLVPLVRRFTKLRSVTGYTPCKSLFSETKESRKSVWVVIKY